MICSNVNKDGRRWRAGFLLSGQPSEVAAVAAQRSFETAAVRLHALCLGAFHEIHWGRAKNRMETQQVQRMRHRPFSVTGRKQVWVSSILCTDTDGWVPPDPWDMRLMRGQAGDNQNFGAHPSSHNLLHPASGGSKQCLSTDVHVHVIVLPQIELWNVFAESFTSKLSQDQSQTLRGFSKLLQSHRAAMAV